MAASLQQVYLPYTRRSCLSRWYIDLLIALDSCMSGYPGYSPSLYYFELFCSIKCYDGADSNGLTEVKI